MKASLDKGKNLSSFGPESSDKWLQGTLWSCDSSNSLCSKSLFLPWWELIGKWRRRWCENNNSAKLPIFSCCCPSTLTLKCTNTHVCTPWLHLEYNLSAGPMAAEYLLHSLVSSALCSCPFYFQFWSLEVMFLKVLHFFLEKTIRNSLVPLWESSLINKRSKYWNCGVSKEKQRGRQKMSSLIIKSVFYNLLNNKHIFLS